ncbi:MAG: hypothetical protein PF961_01155 [Planctomycetota bacterium]|nr:hypothetical protein [Planctomycetota bacterium]
MGSKHIWINEDNASFYIGFPESAMTEAGCRALVDGYCDGGGVAGLSFCVNVQRALFASRSWESLYVDYDPDGPDDQPCLQWLAPEDRSLGKPCHGRTWVHHLWLLEQRGVDHPAIWLDQSRQRGAEGWLSMRMNDVHHAPKKDAFWHNSLWREHPEYRRASYRDEGWFEEAYDYAHEAVVSHHCALIDELCDRYDLDGLELDWVRWVRHSKPGHERIVAAQLTRVMQHARAATERAAQRLGHPVGLGARLPADLASCVHLGYDLPTWAKEGLLDHIVLAPFFQQCDFQVDVDLWRALFPAARVLVQPEAMLIPSPQAGEGNLIYDPRFLAGASACALHNGADGVWLFNECYRFTPVDNFFERFPTYRELLTRDAGDLEALRDAPRRQVVSFHQILGPGRASFSALPIALTRPDGSYDFARFRDCISLSLPLGPKPQSSQVRLKLGLSSDTPAIATADLKLWCNATPLTAPATSETGPGKRSFAAPWPRDVDQGLVIEVPLAALHDGDNIIEWLPPAVAGALIWAELEIG